MIIVGKWSMFILRHLPLEIPWENMDIVGNLVSRDILVEIIQKWRYIMGYNSPTI
jgi:hypothetical protein